MNKLLIIAEMAWAHDGSLEKAIKIMREAKKSGAHAIGIHVTDLKSYMVENYGMKKGVLSSGDRGDSVYDYLNKINLTENEWMKFSKEAKKENIKLCVMPNDINSLKFCEDKIHPAFYVLSAASFVEKQMIKNMSKTKSNIILRIGGASLGEIEECLSLLSKTHSKKISLLHGFQNYPTKLEECNINQLKTLSDLFSVPVGLADHLDGGEEFAISMPLLAIALGSRIIEKHITLDRREKGEDFEAALNPKDFKKFVEFLNMGLTALGNPSWNIMTNAELSYRNISRKKTVAKRSLKKGHVLQEKDLDFKRSNDGICPSKSSTLIGRVLTKDINIDQGIDLNELK